MYKNNNWISLVVSGVLSVGLGWLILARPGAALITLVLVLGLYLLLSGIFDIVMALFHHDDDKAIWVVLAGALSVMVGLFVLNNAAVSVVVTPLILTYIVAFSFIINGLVKMIVGKPVGSGKKGQNMVWTWGGLLYGLLLLIIGIYLLFAPALYAVAIVVATVGWLAVITGVLSIVYGLVDRSERAKA